MFNKVSERYLWVAVVAGLLGSCTEAPQSVPALSKRAELINGTSCNANQGRSTVALIAEIEFAGGSSPLLARAFVCNGVLIAPDVVLTSAQCFSPDLFGTSVTIVGRKYYATFNTDVTPYVSSGAYPPVTPPALPADAIAGNTWVEHPQYDPLATSWLDGVSNGSDVGLLFLERPSNVRPAVLITTSEASQLFVDSDLTMVAYGQLVETTNPQDPPPMGLKKCGTSFVNEIGPYEMQVGKDANSVRNCGGDLGAPSFMQVTTSHVVKERVVGITSRPYESNMMDPCSIGGIHTRVDAQLTFIEQAMTWGCTDSLRAWCTVQGIIPPSYYDTAHPMDLGVPSDGAVQADGSAPRADGGLPGADSWWPTDTGGVGREASMPPSDGGSGWPYADMYPVRRPPEEGGCQLGSTRDPGAGPLFFVALFVFVAIRSRRES